MNSANHSMSTHNSNAGGIISIEEYRQLLSDTVSTDEQIKKRIAYLESFCGNIIRNEIHTYAGKKSKQ
ncbi:MAG: hypothetical protein JWO50_763 [Candidatus Kaiserbacteria bacterium]|nr:hypothetical protein [Candidatus Kaiserbacteria bacterium]